MNSATCDHEPTIKYHSDGYICGKCGRWFNPATGEEELDIEPPPVEVDSSRCQHEPWGMWSQGGQRGTMCAKCNAYLDVDDNPLPETTPNSDMLAVLFVILVFLMGVVVGAAAVYSVQGG